MASEGRRRFLRWGLGGAAAGFAARVGRAGAAPDGDKLPEGKMPMRRLGRTGVDVSLVGLGGYHIGQAADEQTAVRIIRARASALGRSGPCRAARTRAAPSSSEVNFSWVRPLSVLICAARSAAPPGGVLVGEHTYRATGRAIEYAEHEPIEAKGKVEPLRVWLATGRRASFGIDLGSGRRAPLVGREDELDVLARALSRARTQLEPQLVTLVGVPGIGKSRLVQELFQVVEEIPELIDFHDKHKNTDAVVLGINFEDIPEIRDWSGAIRGRSSTPSSASASPWRSYRLRFSSSSPRRRSRAVRTRSRSGASSPRARRCG